MDTSKIQKFSNIVREKLLGEISGRAAFFGILPHTNHPVDQEYADSIVIYGKVFDRKIKKQRERLVKKIRDKGFEQVIDEITYTWFNRFIALKFMEVNGYLPVRVFSSKTEGKMEPDLLTESLNLDFLKIDQALVITMKDENKDEELYKYLILELCHYLHTIMPFLFEKIGDHTELLFPERLLHTDSIIHDLNTICDPADWNEIEIIGWLYQFYISKKKDQVIGKVVKSEDIPAATQLFTPNWIVKYMVQNSLGAQWMATYPQSPLRGQMKYYIEPAEQTEEVKAQLAAITPSTLNPEELTLIDPASGSGHILVEAYELFKAIYLERGYRQADVAQLILEKNLFGLEICPRAAQLTGFAMMMKGRADDRRLFERGVKLNVMVLVDSAGFDAERLIEGVKLADYGLQLRDLTELKRVFEHATTFGSLIQVPERLAAKLLALKQLSKVTNQDLFVMDALKHLAPLVQRAELLAKRYDVVVANPPYMGGRYMNPEAKKFATNYFPDAKSDLFACFIERGYTFAKSVGFNAMVTMQSWMFLSSFEGMRDRLLHEKTIRTMAHMSNGVMGIAFGTAATILQNFALPGYVADFSCTSVDDLNAEGVPSVFPVRNNRLKSIAQDELKTIPGSPLAYWLSENFLKLFELNKFSACVLPKFGMSVGDGDRFIRRWTEVSFNSIGFGFNNELCFSEACNVWAPLDKGGRYRKWFGNLEHVVYWKNKGAAIRKSGSAAVRSPQYFFWPRISWTLVTSGHFSARLFPQGTIIDTASNCIYQTIDNIDLKYLAILNSTPTAKILGALNPTMNYSCGVIGNVPILSTSEKQRYKIADVIEKATNDWNAYERSWDFKSLPFIPVSSEPTPTLKSSYIAWITQNRGSIAEMKRLEEENNRLFIDAYGLANELTHEVPLSQITLTVNPAYRYGGKLTEEEQWTRFRQDTMQELISYAVGCMFGRYSLDKPGLILANQGETIVDFNKKVPNATFSPDSDNIIPILDDEYFEDDIVTRFKKFLEVTFSKESLSENLDFIAEALKPNSKKSSEDIIRDYFLKDFFKEHCKMYKKRPIYWLFTSGKKRAFNAIIYMHRYDTELMAKMRIDYLHELESKLQARFDILECDDVKVSRERQKLRTMIDEMVAYDEILKNKADEFVKIDLDDGVKVNHAKFEGLVAKI